MGVKRTFRNRIRNVTTELVGDGGRVARAAAKGLAFVAGRMNVLAGRLDGTDARVSRNEERLGEAESELRQLGRFNMAANNAREESRRAVQEVGELRTQLDENVQNLENKLDSKADADEQNTAWSGLERRLAELEQNLEGMVSTALSHLGFASGQEKPEEAKPEPKPSTQDTKPQEQDAVPETVHREPETVKPVAQDSGPETADVQPDIELEVPAGEELVTPITDEIPAVLQKPDEEPEAAAPQEDQAELMAEVEKSERDVEKLYEGGVQFDSTNPELGERVQLLEDALKSYWSNMHEEDVNFDADVALEARVQAIQKSVVILEQLEATGDQE